MISNDSNWNAPATSAGTPGAWTEIATMEILTTTITTNTRMLARRGHGILVSPAGRQLGRHLVIQHADPCEDCSARPHRIWCRQSVLSESRQSDLECGPACGSGWLPHRTGAGHWQWSGNVGNEIGCSLRTLPGQPHSVIRTLGSIRFTGIGCVPSTPLVFRIIVRSPVRGGAPPGHRCLRQRDVDRVELNFQSSGRA